MPLALLLLQAAAPSAALPDIELNVRARAKSVEIVQKGEARLEVRAEPDAGSAVDIRVDPPAQGRTRLRNVEVNVRAAARLAPAPEIDVAVETPRPE